MDYSKYKKISSDDKTTCLRHPAGHEIKIAHSALNPRMRDQLHKLPTYAQGGTVEAQKKDQPVINVNLGPQVVPDVASMEIPQTPQQTPYEQQLASLQNEFPGLAKAKGGDQALAAAAIPAAEKQITSDAEKAKGLQSQNVELAAEAKRKQAVGAPLSDQERAALSAAPPQDPRQAKYDQLMGMINEPDKAQAMQPSAVQSGLGNFQSGIQQEAAAQGDLAKRQAAIMEQEQAQYAQKQQMQEQKFQELTQESEILRNDILSGKIDANRYLNQMSDGKRVMTAVGLFLGGLGGGLLGKGNAAMDFLNAQIDRDIKAQENDLGSKQNLLSKNLQEMGNLRDAMELTRTQYKDMLAAKIEIEAAKSKNPILQAQAKQAIGKLMIENSEKFQSMAQNYQGPLGQIQRLPKDLRDQALKEFGDVKGIQSSIKKVDDLFKRFDQVQSVSSRVGSPIQSSSELEIAQAQLFPIIKSIVGEKMSEGDVQNMVRPYLPKLLDSNETRQRKKQSLINMLQGQIPGRAPILSEAGITPDASKYNFTPRK